MATRHSIPLPTDPKHESAALVVPVTRPYSVHLITGFHSDEKLATEHLGNVLAFDPQSHGFVSLGLTLEMGRKLHNYYIRINNDCYPKWEGFRRVRHSRLAESYRSWLEQSCGSQRAQA